MSVYQVWWLMPVQTYSTSSGAAAPSALAICRHPFCTPWHRPMVFATPPWSIAAQVFIAIGLA